MVHGRTPNPHSKLCDRLAQSWPSMIDTLQDYWEDASVSLRSCASLEASPSTHAVPEFDERTKTRACPMACSHITPRDLPCSTDSHEFMASVKRRRSFPPPLASCTTVSIKGGGRFVLKEMLHADGPQGFIRSERENGRLRLHLVLPDQSAAAPTEGNVDNQDLQSCISHDNGGQGETEDGTSYGGECNGYGSCNEETRNSVRGIDDIGSFADCKVLSLCESENVGTEVESATCVKSSSELRSVVFGECREAIVMGSDPGNREPNVVSCDRLLGGEEATTSVVESFGLEPKSSPSSSSRIAVEQDSSLVHQHEESLWCVNLSGTKGAPPGTWPPNHLLVSQPIVRMRPALGLAMS